MFRPQHLFGCGLFKTVFVWNYILTINVIKFDFSGYCDTRPIKKRTTNLEYTNHKPRSTASRYYFYCDTRPRKKKKEGTIINPDPPLEDIVLFGLSLRLKALKFRLLEDIVYPLRGTARRLAHCPVSGSDTICNDPDPPLADIVLFELFLSGFPSMTLLRKGFHILINDVLFSSPTNVGHHIIILHQI